MDFPVFASPTIATLSSLLSKGDLNGACCGAMQLVSVHKQLHATWKCDFIAVSSKLDQSASQFIHDRGRWEEMLCSRISQRFYQKATHPHHFRQILEMTDGSCIETTCMSSKRQFVKLALDSLNHPSWNPSLSDKSLIDEQGKISKFEKRFGDVADLDFLDSIESAPQAMTVASAKKTKEAKK